MNCQPPSAIFPSHDNDHVIYIFILVLEKGPGWIREINLVWPYTFYFTVLIH